MKTSDDNSSAVKGGSGAAPNETRGVDLGSAPGSDDASTSGAAARGAEAGAGADAGSGPLSLLMHCVGELSGAAERLFDVYADRARLAVQRKFVQVAVGAGIAVCAALWVGAAALALLRGLCGGLTSALGGRAWLGDVTGGLLALALAAGAAVLLIRVSAQRDLRRLRTKYERARKNHEDTPQAATPAHDGR